MKPKKNYFGIAITLSIIIINLTLLVSADLEDPKTTYLWTLAVVLAINLGAFAFERIDKKN